jgi:hypothetical protein
LARLPPKAGFAPLRRLPLHSLHSSSPECSCRADFVEIVWTVTGRHVPTPTGPVCAPLGLESNAGNVEAARLADAEGRSRRGSRAMNVVLTRGHRLHRISHTD